MGDDKKIDAGQPPEIINKVIENSGREENALSEGGVVGTSVRKADFKLPIWSDEKMVDKSTESKFRVIVDNKLVVCL